MRQDRGPWPFASRSAAEAVAVASLRKRFLEGVLWTSAATAVGQGLPLLGFVIAGRVLGRTMFGEFSMVQGTVGLFGMYSGFGLAVTATKHVAQYRKTDPTRAGRIIGMTIGTTVALSLAVAVLLAVFSPWVASHLINAPHLAPALRVASLLVVFNSLIGVENGILNGLEAFRLVAAANLVRGFLVMAMISTGVLLAGTFGGIVGLTAGTLCGWLVGHLLTMRETARLGVRPVYGGAFAERSVLGTFSLPVLLCNVMVGVSTWTARALLVNQADGYSEMGVFNAATRFQSVVAVVGTTIGTALLPLLVSREGSRSARLAKGSMLVSWVIGVGASLPILCFPEIVSLVFGVPYSGQAAYACYSLVMAYTVVMLFSQGIIRALIAGDMMWLWAGQNAVFAAVLVMATLLLRDRGAVGLSVAYLAAYAVSTAAFVPVYHRRGLLPERSLVSLESLAVWVSVAGITALSLSSAGLLQRSGAFLVAAVVIGVGFARMVRGPARVPVSDVH